MARESSQKRKRKRRKTPLLVKLYHLILTISFLIVLGFFAVEFLLPQAEIPTFAPTVLENSPDSDRKPGVYNFLLVGTDNGSYNADTMMVTQFDSNTGAVSLISVPRDTLVYREWSNFPKLNAAYSQGIALLQEEISYTLGIPLDFYVHVSLDAFIQVVDALGGLDFYVPQDMYHDDQGGFIIDLKEGQQTLDGHQTLELVRYRGYATADIGRTQTHQAVLKALTTQLVSVSSLLNINKYLDIFQENMDTDLSANDFMWFAKEILSWGEELSIYSQTLDGVGNAKYNGYTWCYELDKQSTLETVNLYLNPFQEPLTLDNMRLLSAQSYH